MRCIYLYQRLKKICESPASARCSPCSDGRCWRGACGSRGSRQLPWGAAFVLHLNRFSQRGGLYLIWGGHGCFLNSFLQLGQGYLSIWAKSQAAWCCSIEEKKLVQSAPLRWKQSFGPKGADTGQRDPQSSLGCLQFIPSPTQIPLNTPGETASGFGNQHPRSLTDLALQPKSSHRKLN